MILLYNLLYSLLLIPGLFFLFIIYRKRLKAEGVSSLKERLGFWSYSPASDKLPVVWIHCASLGEVKAVEPLISNLGKYKIVITTLTASGRDYAHKRKLSNHLYYAPLDTAFIVQRVLERIKPKALILVETELWPAMISTAHKFGVKIILVNARLSQKSFPYYSITKKLWKNVVPMIDYIAARSKEDASRLLEIGADIARLEVSGNMKYDVPSPEPERSRADMGFNDKDTLVVFGSARDGEEGLIIDVYKRLLSVRPSIKFIVAPRHIEKINDFAELLNKSGIEYSYFSSDKRSGLVIVDRFGVLTRLYAVCDIAVIGGSLVDRGGQNPIEPANYSKPVLFGPFMSNFSSEANILLDHGGAIKVLSETDLLFHLEELAGNRELAREIGKKAKLAVESQRGAVSITAGIIDKVLGQND